MRVRARDAVGYNHGPYSCGASCQAQALHHQVLECFPDSGQLGCCRSAFWASRYSSGETFAWVTSCCRSYNFQASMVSLCACPPPRPAAVGFIHL